MGRNRSSGYWLGGRRTRPSGRLALATLSNAAASARTYLMPPMTTSVVPASAPKNLRRSGFSNMPHCTRGGRGGLRDAELPEEEGHPEGVLAGLVVPARLPAV